MDAPTLRHRYAKVQVCTTTEREGASEMKITTVGIDLAKNVFQIHGVDERGKTRCSGSN
jgi:transposase